MRRHARAGRVRAVGELLRGSRGGRGRPRARRSSLRSRRRCCSDAYFRCAADAIQIHGGVGFTWELDCHLYFKRAKSSETLLGDAAYHRERVASRIGLYWGRLMAVTIDMTGRVVIVTGGGRGVGRGITARFLEAGAEVVVCGRNPPETPVAAGGRAGLLRRGRRARARADRPSRDRGARALRPPRRPREQRGRCAAGRCGDGFTALLGRILALNLTAPLHFAQRANAVMQAQEEGGSIIQITSVSGLRPSPGAAAYGAAKAGLISLTQTLAVEWAPKVRVNAVAAGMIRTEQSHLYYGDEAGVARVERPFRSGASVSPRTSGTRVSSSLHRSRAM